MRTDRRVLIVEDHAETAEMLAELLMSVGIACDTVGDGEAAPCAVRELRPSVVLLDLNVPKVDGWQVTQRLKADPQTRSVPVIGMTWPVEREDIQRALQAGCDGFLRKPFDLDELEDTVRRYLPEHGRTTLTGTPEPAVEG